MCRFADENRDLQIYKNYSQSNCLFECFYCLAQKAVQQKYNDTSPCVPWYLPSPETVPIICNPWKAFDFLGFMLSIPIKNCTACLPDCSSTIYKIEMTAVPFSQCNLRNMGAVKVCQWNGDSISNPLWPANFVVNSYKNRFLAQPYFTKNVVPETRRRGSALIYGDVFGVSASDYETLQTDIATVEIYFKTASIMEIQQAQRMSWLDFISNVGGLLGLLLGMGFISVFEILWFTIKQLL